MLTARVVLALLVGSAAVATAMTLDESHATPRDERQVHAAWVGFMPADGQMAEVNPPRFAWPYDPQIVAPDGYEREHTFTLQIARRADMSRMVLEVETPWNFYNAIPSLPGRYVFWRVGYDVGTETEAWSRVRCFSVEPWTPEWDRSMLEELDQHLQGHPRLGFTPQNLEALRALHEVDEGAARLYEALISRADAAMEEEWFSRMPAEDPIIPMDHQREAEYTCVTFRNISRKMQVIAMAYMLTGDEKYLAVRAPLVQLASYPPGGESSPEGLGPRRKWATMVTMHLGLCYDWLYPQLTQQERETIAHSLDWRIAHILNDFSWRRNGRVFSRGLAGMVGSHQYQNALWTLVGALAVYDESEAAAELTELTLHYLCGVTNGFGAVESWNEGVSYGNGKCGTLLDAACWTAMTLPELHIERNPYWRNVGGFFAYLTPLGIERSAWGNYGKTAATHLRLHQRNFRRFAFLTGEGRFLQNWHSCNEILGTRPSVWQEYLMPHFFEEPRPRLEGAEQALFNIGGWAMALSGPPSAADTYRHGVGMIFHSRPRGGYSHSFNNENAFEAFAYGSVIATGGGRKANGDRHADATMSHNSVLVDGLGQDFNQMEPATETAGRIIAWHAEPGLVYWCADATEAYEATAPYLDRFLRHVLFVDDRCFVIFDDLAIHGEHEPARFSWLYHVHQDVPVEIDQSAASFSYTVGGANVKVRHLLGAGTLAIQNLRGEDGYRNPITGEDMLEAARGSVERSPLRKFSGEPVWNNMWVTSTPRRTWQFLAAILPWREGGEEPTVERLGERHLRIETEAGARTIFFGSPSEQEADIIVDYERTRLLGGDPEPPEPGESLWEPDLSDTSDWVLDGEGSVEHLAGGAVQITTETPTTYWAPEVFEEPVLFDFEARTEDDNARAIFFFMAEGVNGEDIFTWEREGDYGEYAFEERMELYTAGMLREGCGTEANFRRIGLLTDDLAILRTPREEIPEDRKEEYAEAIRRFQPYSIHDSAVDGYRLGEWMRYQVLVDGGLVRVFADGTLLHEVTYEEPLRRGRIGFRNFGRGSSLQVRGLSASRPQR
ncbi:MAG: DUF1961 family protein [Armatimonadota bacterium]|nr:DUF1961 family protein [Armatimonadota bacterium]